MKKILAIVAALAVAAAVLGLTAFKPGRVEKIMKKMSLRDKVTQMMMVDFRYWDQELPLDEAGKVDESRQTRFTVMNPQVEEIIRDYNFGAVIYFAQNLGETEQVYNLTMAMQQAAAQDGGIPMLISADQEGGSVYRLSSGTALPGNMALAATGASEYARRSGEIIGNELSVLGINTSLAPVVDVNNNASNPVIGVRSFGDDPAVVGEMAGAVAAGMAEYNVIGCAKHFPGHGDTETDSHYGLPCVNKGMESLQACELAPYETIIGQGIDMIMTAHILYPQLEKDSVISEKTGKPESLPATMSDDIITGLLKGKMGFDGVVITDAMDMEGITGSWDSGQAAVLAIQAGADMLCMPWRLHSPGEVEKLNAIIERICAAVQGGEIPMERIDDAVERILTLKEKRGILDWKAADYSLERALETVGCAANREAEREIAAAAVTVVQNRNNTLPLQIHENSRVLMMVPYENEMAQMIMGWNRAKDAGLIPGGAEVQAVRFNGESTAEDFRKELAWADTIIFNSEISRADRMNGGRWESAFILSILEIAQAEGKTTVVQSVDKPYDVQSYPGADAVLAVYGCKGSTVDPTEALVGGVAASEAACGPNIIAGVEVMLGVYGAKGKLPVDIPVYENGAYGDALAYPRGYGLSYATIGKAS